MNSIDFESQPLYTMLFTVDDDRGPSFQTYVNLAVRDINEAPFDVYLTLPLTLSTLLVVLETAPLNTLVGTLGCQDPDRGQSFRYSLLRNGPPPPLYVDQAPAVGSPAYLRTNGTLDYDAIPLYPVGAALRHRRVVSCDGA
jgi:hypothetical protein